MLNNASWKSLCLLGCKDKQIILIATFIGRRAQRHNGALAQRYNGTKVPHYDCNLLFFTIAPLSHCAFAPFFRYLKFFN
jgi:hypothetical protein